MNAANLDSIRAIFETDETARPWYVITEAGKFRIVPVTITSIDNNLNCSVVTVDVGGKVSNSISAEQLYETPEDALIAFEARQTEDHNKAVADVAAWRGGKDG